LLAFALDVTNTGT